MSDHLPYPAQARAAAVLCDLLACATAARLPMPHSSTVTAERPESYPTGTVSRSGGIDLVVATTDDLRDWAVWFKQTSAADHVVALAEGVYASRAGVAIRVTAAVGVAA